jgi:hypothetical protein
MEGGKGVQHHSFNKHFTWEPACGKMSNIKSPKFMTNEEDTRNYVMISQNKLIYVELLRNSTSIRTQVDQDS